MNQTQMATPQVPADPPAVDIRSARPDDEERVGDFVAGLSLRSQTLRFFTGMKRPDSHLVRALIAVDDRRHALLAVVGDVIGHAMSFTRSDGVIEIAVVVADEWQGGGMGSRLVRRLLRRAVVAGADIVGMDVMGENRMVLSMIKHLWPDARMRVESCTVEVIADIGALR